MAVYVDDAVWPWKGTLWCHLLADDLDELHRFARLLGMERRWFQQPPHVRFPHYDLTIGKRVYALHLGAQAIDRRTTVIKARALRMLWWAENTTGTTSHGHVTIKAPSSPASDDRPSTNATRTSTAPGHRSMFPRPGRRA